MKNFHKVLTCILLLSASFHYSQNETKKWYFGMGAALDFVTNPPTNISNTSWNANVSGASVADANGNLLFYTNGITIWNSSHTVMPNGSGLIGTGAHIRALIVKQPPNQNIYYVFTVPNFSAGSSTLGLYYSIVDMSLAAGQGSVTVKNASLYQGSLCSKLTGTKHCNGTDFWIMVKTCSSSNTCVWDGAYNFRAYQLSATGISTVATVSTFTYSAPSALASARGGQMKISPNGKRLACANYAFCAPYNSNASSFELYDFNNANGQVSNLTPLYSLPSNTVAFANTDAYGVEFSPDASKLYGTLSNNIFYPNGSLLEWDLCVANSSLIASTQTSIATPTFTPYNGFATMQLAPDGKIYVAHYVIDNTSVSVINFPNLYGAASGFSLSVPSVSPGTTNYFLPNFMGSQFFLAGALPAFNFSTNLSPQDCNVAHFQSQMLPGTSVGNCSTNSYTLQNLSWNFGDPNTGQNNFSNLPNPSHAYSAAGLYTVQLTLDFGCGGGKQTLTQTLSVNNPTSGIGYLSYTGNLPCNGVSTGTAGYVNQQNPNITYSWTNGTNTFTTTTLSSLSAGSWTSVATNTANGCQAVSVFTIQQPPVLLATLSTPSVCLNKTISAIASGGTSPFNYLWSNGMTSTVIVGNLLGANTLTITDANACTVSSNFSVFPNPTISVSGQTLCAKSEATVVAVGADSYSWSNGSSMSQLLYSSVVSGSFSFTVVGQNNFGCTDSSAFDLNFLNCNSISEFGFNSRISVYPNPSSGELFFSEDNADFLIHNAFGQMILSGKTQESVLLNQAGVYYISLVMKEKETRVYKIVIVQ